MDGPGAGTALGLLVLELIEFTQYFERDTNVIVPETIKAVGIVQQHIGIEDEIFPDGGGGLETISVDWPLLDLLLLSPFDRSANSEHLGLEGSV